MFCSEMKLLRQFNCSRHNRNAYKYYNSRRRSKVTATRHFPFKGVEQAATYVISGLLAVVVKTYRENKMSK